MWSFMASWSTPAALFCVLNIMIGTIFLTSKSKTHTKSENEHNQPQLVRHPSILQRVMSINFSLHRSEHSGEVPHDAVPHHDRPQIEDHHVTRSRSDTTGEASPAMAAAPKRMRKSASEKAIVEVEEEVDRRRPATVREGNQVASFGEDEGVDAKADDFINRFKQQLKLQRLDSILRYKELLNRGSGK
ncbi:hypothetical protein U1Q18_028724 [Sarracenia purpurea var. burkii]